MARRRRKKKSLSGLGALPIDPKIMLGGLLIVGVAAYFLLRKKDDEMASDSSAMLPQDTMASGAGTPVQSPAASALIAKIQANPEVAAKLRNLQVGQSKSASIASKLGIR